MLVIAGLAVAASGALVAGVSLTTPIPQLVLAFTALGIGMGSINPPITNAAVSGMPRAQAGVAGGIASTSRQVGASLGVAIAGSITAIDAHDPGFAASTHPFWWVIVGAGLAIVALGFISTGLRARSSAQAIAALVAD
jgi:MFS family permease